MKYWIPIDSWNLMETFVTESLSPHVFYQNRLFGNDLTRYINHANEMYQHLILLKNEPRVDFAIEVDESLLDSSLLERADKKAKDIFFYPKTIYYKKGFVRFFFKDEALLKAFMAESKIIIEVKTIEKYKDAFTTRVESACKPYSRVFCDTFAFNTENCMIEDTFYNSVKGGIVAYVCGILSNTDKKTQSAQLVLNELKNNMTGLHTTIMLGDTVSVNVSQFRMMIAKANATYKAAQLPPTSIFESILNQFSEIASLSKMRADEISFKKSDDYFVKLEEMEKRKDEIATLITKIECEYKIDELRNELDHIKNEEVKRGKAEGKTRKFFPKGSEEYKRKKHLEAQIDTFEKDNVKYRTLRSEYRQLQGNLSQKNGSRYDNVISAVFIRISDSINDLAKLIRDNTKRSQLSEITDFYIENRRFVCKMPFASAPECDYFNILINKVLCDSIEHRLETSESYVLSLIVETAKTFKSQPSSGTPEGELIINTLREYWRYKNQEADIFDIPGNLGLLKVIMSFFIKVRGFDQIERFMLNRGYSHKEFAYMLLGTLHGFANLPKTLTNDLYLSENQSSENVLEDYLTSIY